MLPLHYSYKLSIYIYIGGGRGVLYSIASRQKLIVDGMVSWLLGRCGHSHYRLLNTDAGMTVGNKHCPPL